ncbi:MAG: hypothetical protein ACLFNK_04245 [Candidatus Woesearchaeota archaeon]
MVEFDIEAKVQVPYMDSASQQDRAQESALMSLNERFGLADQTLKVYGGTELLPDDKYSTLKAFSDSGDPLSTKVMKELGENGTIPQGNMIPEKLLLRKMSFEEYHSSMGVDFARNEYDFMTRFLENTE